MRRLPSVSAVSQQIADRASCADAQRKSVSFVGQVATSTTKLTTLRSTARKQTAFLAYAAVSA